MNKLDFINLYKISDATPLDPTRKSIPSEAFSTAIEQFLDERFVGAIRVRTGIISAQPIMICAEYIAYFFKVLLSDIYGRVFLNTRIDTDEQGLKITISADEDLPLTDSEMRNLIRLARNAGFEIKPDKKSIYLSTNFSVAATRRVYAVSIMDGRRIMLGKLVEIFCHGELMSAEPKAREPMTQPIKPKTKSKSTK